MSKEGRQKAWTSLHMLSTRKDMSVQDIQKELGISKGTYYRYIECAELDEKEQLIKTKKRKL